MKKSLKKKITAVSAAAALILLIGIGRIIEKYEGMPFTVETIQIDETQNITPTGEPQVLDNKININTADSDLLCTLNGIGEATAEKIIAYRTEHGDFGVIEDLMNVSGIGEKSFEKIREAICVR